MDIFIFALVSCYFRHLACEEDREAVACMLVKAGSNTEIKNAENKSPLDLCSMKLKKTLNSLKD